MGTYVDTLTTAKRSGDSVLDAPLITRCKNRDAEAFGMLIDRYQARVYGFVRRMVSSREDAEDVAQEVFIRAFQNIARFDGRASLLTWLFKIASNLCIDRARRRDRRPEELALTIGEDNAGAEPEPVDYRWDPEVSAIAGEMQDVVELAITSMSPKLRGVLLLHDLEGLGYNEIAEVLSIPVGTVKSRLFLARAHLQDALKGYLGGESQP